MADREETCSQVPFTYFFRRESPGDAFVFAFRTKAMLVKIAEENKKDLPLPRWSM